MRSVAEARRRPAAEWIAAGEAAWLLAWARLCLSVAPGHWSDGGGFRPRRTAAGAVGPARLAALVAGVAAHHPLRPTCLPTAMALGWMLARRGHAVTLVLGARTPAAGALDAHAWIECDGIQLLASPTIPYTCVHRVSPPDPVPPAA